MKKVIISLLIILFLTGCTININNYSNNNEEQTKENSEVEDITTNESNDNNKKEDIKYENNQSKDENNNNTYNNNINNNNNINSNTSNELVDTTNIKTEEDVLNYFVKLKEKVIEISKSDAWENTKDKLMNSLNKAYGFCFKGEEIGGYTLNELSNSVKEKILNIVFDIDEFVESASPGYKDSFKDSYNTMIESAKKSLGLIKDKITEIFSDNKE